MLEKNNPYSKWAHYDVIKWKHFPRNWPFVRGIHRSPVTRSFDVYFDLRPNKRLSKHSWGWWFETLSSPLWRHRNAWSIHQIGTNRQQSTTKQDVCAQFIGIWTVCGTKPWLMTFNKHERQRSPNCKYFGPLIRLITNSKNNTSESILLDLPNDMIRLCLQFHQEWNRDIKHAKYFSPYTLATLHKSVKCWAIRLAPEQHIQQHMIHTYSNILIWTKLSLYI